MSRTDMLKVLAEAKAKLRVDQALAEMSDQVDEAHRLRLASLQRADADRNAERRVMQAQIQTLKEALGQAIGVRNGAAPPPPLQTTSDTPAVAPASTPRLRAVIQDFLDSYPKDRKPEMFAKHQAALAPLEALLGDKAVADLKQRDLIDFFDLVQALPRRWAEKCKRRGVSIRALAAEEHDQRLGRKTFTDNYLNPISIFIEKAQTNWQDQGFPMALTTRAIEFKGEDDEGKNKQRAMTTAELRRLFGEVLAPFRDEPAQAHRWWLPVLAFYTGARVNELCQINPQIDVRTSPEGIEHLLITEDTEGDPGIKKSVKTKVQRHVPLHPDLIEAGFLEYVRTVRATGAKLLFPAWRPTNGRASTQAERWFRDLLRDEKLRDDTPGARVVGFHAFRHTLLAMALNSNPAVDAGPITGHVDTTKSGTQRGYEGELNLPNKLKLLSSIQFTFKP
ncbi:MAG: tyrosine-type recombinase/integrase [Proteobacteria bacterium]|nr:tyrosine-type recombinase/integrase [Pseudomonadota bacterium]